MAMQMIAALVALAIIELGIAHPEGRSLHDLLLGSAVVRRGDRYTPSKASAQMAYTILIAICAMALKSPSQ